MKQFIPFLMLLSCISTTSVSATNPVNLGKLAYAGNGCPNGEGNPILIRLKNNIATIIPTEMTLSTWKNDRSFQRKKCDFALAVTVESGYQVRIEQAKVQGFVALDSASSASIALATGFAGKKFTQHSENYSAETVKNTALAVDASEWSLCGSDVIVRAKLSASLRGDNTQSSYVSAHGMSFKIAHQACQTD